MGRSKPPPRASKAPSNAPKAKGDAPAERATKPPRRQTMEVQIAWLDKDSEPAGSPAPRKKPPRVPGAALTLPPMPVDDAGTPPPPRNTMEVDMRWVELVDEPADPPARAKSEKPAKKRPLPKPIKREED